MSVRSLFPRSKDSIHLSAIPPYFLPQATQFLTTFRNDLHKASPATQADRWQQFIENLYAEKREGTEEEWEEKIDKVEQVLVGGAMYESIYSPPLSDDPQEDSHLQTTSVYLRTRSLNLEHLGVPASSAPSITVLGIMLAQAGPIFASLSKTKIPAEKIAIIWEGCAKVMSVLTQHTSRPNTSDKPGYNPTSLNSRSGSVSVDMSGGKAHIVSNSRTESRRMSEIETPKSEGEGHLDKMSTPITASSEVPTTAAGKDEVAIAPTDENDETAEKPDRNPLPPLPDRNPKPLSPDPLNVVKSTVSYSSGPKSPLPKASTSANADLMLPMLIYLLVYSHFPNIVSDIRYIGRFRRQSAVTGEAGYCFTMVNAAVSFLQTANVEELVGGDDSSTPTRVQPPVGKRSISLYTNLEPNALKPLVKSSSSVSEDSRFMRGFKGLFGAAGDPVAISPSVSRVLEPIATSSTATYDNAHLESVIRAMPEVIGRFGRDWKELKAGDIAELVTSYGDWVRWGQKLKQAIEHNS